MALEPGTWLNHYKIQSLIGVGGMGEVYLAHDARRQQPAAVKILKAELTNSREHLRRFEKEARAISALKHSNTLTVYDIGRVDKTYFIATEFINGSTLRKIIESGPPSLNELLDIALQIVSAVAAAHSSGIIHRDLKPENIMVRPDGCVKVLDFGLAKLTEDLVQQSSLSKESTVSNALTGSGAVIGTINYMSPEQLRGLTVDVRTDLWSIGVVLYELVTGRTPFADASSADVIVSILEREAPPLTVYSPKCPNELQRIIMNALRKDREQRYQAARKLFDELLQLQAALHLAADIDGPEASDQESAPPVFLTPTGAGTQSGANGSSARLLLQKRSVAKRRLALLLNGLLLLLVAGLALTIGLKMAAIVSLPCLLAINVYLLAAEPAKRFHMGAKAVRPFNTINLIRLTNTSTILDATISPDGNYVAYVVDTMGKQSLWVRHLQRGNNVEVVPPNEVTYQGLTISPDGAHIYYVMFRNDNRRLYSLYRIPLNGGESVKVMEDVDTPVTFSANSEKFAFVRGYPSQKEVALVVANSDGTAERRLTTRRSPDIFGWRGGPAWSPDEKLIACSVGVYDASMRLVGISVEDGSEQPLSAYKWQWVGRLAWLQDGSGLVVSARDASSGYSQLWYVSYPLGEVRRISNDLSDYSARGVSVTSDSSVIVSVQSDYLSGIWVASRNQRSPARQLTFGRTDGYYGLCWTPDGRIIFASKASGNMDIWSMDPDGGNQVQLTFNAGSNYHPAMTIDGSRVIFISTRTGAPDIWSMDANGNSPKQLTNGSIPGWPQCTPDGQWIIYKAMGFGKKSLCKVPINGGVPVQISDKYTGCIAVSPDGRSIACEYWDEELTSQLSLAVMPLNEAGQMKVFDSRPTAMASNYLLSVIRWTPDGGAVTYIDNSGGFGNIWSQPLAGEKPTQLTDFHADRIFWFDWSHDGQWLACARGVITSDIVLIKSMP